MKRVNLESYKVKGAEWKDGVPTLIDKNFDVKTSIINVMYNPSQQLGRQDIRAREKIAEKIEVAEKEIYLEDSEFAIINNSFDSFKGFNRNDNELIKRIDEAESVTPEQLMAKAKEAIK